MIDTVGRGIKKIYTEQRNRFFPMPDYDIDNEHRTVGVTIYGKMIDEKYTNLLKSNQSLSLKECLWLDAVQKHHPITKEAAKLLFDKGLIEGRAPHYTISLKVAKLTNQIGHYTKREKDLQKKVSKSYYCNWHIMQEKWDFGAEMHSKVFSMFFLQIIAMMKNYEE